MHNVPFVLSKMTKLSILFAKIKLCYHKYIWAKFSNNSTIISVLKHVLLFCQLSKFHVIHTIITIKCTPIHL